MKRLLILLALLPMTANAMEKIAEVEHSSTSVILRFPLYDAAAPDECASDVTISTSGLQINVSTDKSAGYYDQYQQSDSTLETITTIGTYATPTATKARFKIIATGACTYELQLPDAAFAVTDANIMTIAITDGATQIIDSVYWVDLTPVSLSSWAAYDCSSDSTDDTIGYQICTALDAVLTDTGTTLDTKINTVSTNTSFDIAASDACDSGSATTCVDADQMAGTDDIYNNGARLEVDFATGVESRCIRDYDSATTTATVFPAFSTAITTETYRIVTDTSCRNFP